MNEVVIKSADTAAQLVLSNIEGDYFTATYKSHDVFLSRRVWSYTDCYLLVDLFAYMAKEWKGWDGEIEWASIEQEFSITCTSDQKGHIEVKLKYLPIRRGRTLGCSSNFEFRKRTDGKSFKKC